MKTATLLSIALGLAAGCIYGDERRRRKYFEQYAYDLEKLMEKVSGYTLPGPGKPQKMAVLSNAHR